MTWALHVRHLANEGGLLLTGADRWEPKGRGRGGPEPVRHGPQEGYPDRWVNPADAVRPRGDKWGPAEGKHAHTDKLLSCNGMASALALYLVLVFLFKVAYIPHVMQVSIMTPAGATDPMVSYSNIALANDIIWIV